jgi:hydroxymethylpyrimidine/phosphomethylpyrimidine kinase
MKKTIETPTVLSIAGSDPSGGAGIQADLKTFMAAGVYGAAAIAGLTAQNTMAVDAAIPVPADFVKAQLQSVFTDIRIDAIKLGMLPGREICNVIAPFVLKYPVVCDPVMVATSGGRLVDSDAVTALIEIILPVSDYVTPNLYELEVLYEKPVDNIIEAGMAVMERFPGLKGIALKGGHRPNPDGTVTDTLLYREMGTIKRADQTNPHIDTQNTHGTGCTFSSAMAAFLARKHTPADAFAQAVRMTHRLIVISRDKKIGSGHGPLLHHL